jgi:hypothetical protein
MIIMASADEILIVRNMLGVTRVRNISDTTISTAIDRAWKRTEEETQIMSTDTSNFYYDIASQITERFAAAEILIQMPDLSSLRNSLLNDAKAMVTTVAKPDPSDPDSEILIDSEDYTTYPMNPDGEIYLGSLAGRPRYRTWFGSDFNQMESSQV